MLKKIKIDKIYFNTTNKDNQPYKDKNGRSFTLTVIQTIGKDGQKKKLSFCDYKGECTNWKEGEIVEVDVTKNGQYLNFKPPSRLDLLERRINTLEKKLNNISVKLETQPTPDKSTNIPNDLPF